jgi:hypothetical protein
MPAAITYDNAKITDVIERTAKKFMRGAVRKPFTYPRHGEVDPTLSVSRDDIELKDLNGVVLYSSMPLSIKNEKGEHIGYSEYGSTNQTLGTVYFDKAGKIVFAVEDENHRKRITSIAQEVSMITRLPAIEA